MNTAFSILFILIAIKSFTIGSPFNFYKWMKHGKKYRIKYQNWMNNHP